MSLELKLDSDETNADAQLQVSFYIYEGEGMWKGHAFCRIITPGQSQLSILDRPASEYDKARFQRQWLFFQQGNQKDAIIGTPLVQWRTERPEELTDGQLQELLILKFMSVEQLAMASDAQIQRVGMGAAGLRERARTYLSSKNAQASGAELANTKAELEVLKAQMAQLLAAQAAPAPAPSSPVPKVAKKGGGGWNKGKTFKKGKSEDVQHSSPVGAASL